MITFNDILKFPAQYSKRENSIQKVNMQLADVQDSDEILNIGGICSSQTGQYAQKIEIHKNSKDINLQNPVKLLCSCESFKYEFSGSLLKIESLLESEFFEYAIRMHKPKKKNIYQIPSGCKHIIALARFIWTHKNRPNYGLISNINLQRQFMFLSMQVSMNNWNPRDPYQQANRQKMLQQQRKQKRISNLIK
jgi:effector-binding domain-containing protein